MTEKIDFTNPELSPEELAKCKAFAEKLNAVAPGDVIIQQLARSLELGYADAAKSFYQSQLDKFHNVPREALRIIREELRWEEFD